jgi:phage baseplate assembly protein W
MPDSVQNRKTYDFKSVGELDLDVSDRARQNRIDAVSLPIGIKTPLQLSPEADTLFKMNTRLLDQVSDNLRNLIMTNHGERLGFYDFGANLMELCFELGSEGADKAAIHRIRKAVSKYMPFVTLETFEPIVDRYDNEHTAKIGVRVTYSVPRLTQKKKQIEVILYVAG